MTDNFTFGRILFGGIIILVIIYSLNNPFGCLTEEDCDQQEQKIYLESASYFCEEKMNGFYQKVCRGGGYGGAYSCEEHCIVHNIKYQLYKIDGKWEMVK